MTIRIGRLLLGMAMLGASLLAGAGEPAIVDVDPKAPGQVVITLADLGAPPPRAEDFSLEVGKGSVAASSAAAPTADAQGLLVICVDQSGSVGGGALSTLKAELLRAFATGGAGAMPYRVALVAFDTRAVELLSASRDRRAIAAAMRGLSAEDGRDGKTKLYDALVAQLGKLSSEHAGPRRLMVVSDGKDEGSEQSAEALDGIVQRTGVPIDTVAWGREAQGGSPTLQHLSQLSGGQAHQAPDRKALARALDEVASRAGSHQWTQLSFNYTAAASGRTSTAALVQRRDGRELARWTVAVPLTEVQAPAANPLAEAAPKAAPDSSPLNLLSSVWAAVEDGDRFYVAGAAGFAVVVLATLTLWILSRRRTPATPTARLEPSGSQFTPPMPSRRGATMAGDASPAGATSRRATLVAYVWSEPAPQHAAALLHGFEGHARGRTFPLERRHTRIGAASDNDLVLANDDYVSSHHAILRYEAGSLYVEDLGSSNGTHLNGESFKGSARVLSPGDHLRFGRSTFELQPASVRSR